MTTVGLVHDTLIDFRGPERTFEAIASIWPEAPIYTLVYDEASTDGIFAGHHVWAGFGEGRRVRQRGIARLRPAFPRAVKRLPVWEHDVVVSSSTGFALGVQHRDDAVHVCYVHYPDRETWQHRDEALAQAGRLGRPLGQYRSSKKRREDRAAAWRVTDFVANSEFTRQRIQDYYDRDATVIYPPVEVDRFTIAEPEDYFLVVAELSPHKRVDLALEAVQLAGKRAVVVGSGTEYRRLHREYGKVAEFVRRLRDEEMASLYARAQALIVTSVEEFGIAAVEAQAAGRPVVAVAAGGVLETVVDGMTGALVADATPGLLAEALRNVDFTGFDSAAVRVHAQSFARSRFERALEQHVARTRARVQGDATS